MPQPEELIDITRRDGEPVAVSRTGAPHRDGFEDVIWYRMDIGRRHNADPRWLLPLLCRRGHITRNEIGAIRIAANETYFQVPRTVEPKFRAALQRTARPGSEDENGITIEPSPAPPPGGHGAKAAPGPRAGAKPPYVRAKGRQGGAPAARR